MLSMKHRPAAVSQRPNIPNTACSNNHDIMTLLGGRAYRYIY
jgi:hypothetical protein